MKKDRFPSRGVEKGEEEEVEKESKKGKEKKASLYLLRKVVSQLPWTIRIPRFYTVARRGLTL